MLFQKKIHFVNAINLKSIKVYLDKDIKTLDNKVISAGNNILGYSIADHDMNVESDSLSGSDNLGVYYSQEALDKYLFPKGKAKLSLTGKNSDGIQFKFEKEVYLDL